MKLDDAHVRYHEYKQPSLFPTDNPYLPLSYQKEITETAHRSGFRIGFALAMLAALVLDIAVVAIFIAVIKVIP